MVSILESLTTVYHLELVRSNPDSTVAVTLDPDIFLMCICIDACKKGFLAGCRRVVGLDGCLLKGLMSGQILCAIGRDANNQTFSMGYSWGWILWLMVLVHVTASERLADGQPWRWMGLPIWSSKGLIRSVNEIVPQAEHRMCATHIYANWRKEHRDKKLQKMFWACAKSSDRTQFNYNRAN